MHPSDFSTVLVGVLAPVVTQLVRKHVLRWDDKAAHFLSLLIAAGAVSAAYFYEGGKHSLNSWLGNFGAAFTFSQVVYHQLLERFEGGPLQLEDEEDDSDGGPPTSGPTPLPTGYPGGAISGDAPSAVPLPLITNPVVTTPLTAPTLVSSGNSRS
jgi:hypothetical protein